MGPALTDDPYSRCSRQFNQSLACFLRNSILFANNLPLDTPLHKYQELDTEILAIAPLLDRASDGSDEDIDWELVVPVVERYALKKAGLAFF